MDKRLLKTIKKIKADSNTLLYIREQYLPLCKSRSKISKIGKDHKVFVFWYQGINRKTPETVKLCLKSVLDHYKNVIILDKYNFFKYVTLPKIFIDKLNSKKMSITHFSDVLRVWILEKYGGLWIDASIYIYDNVIDFSAYSFYSVKNNARKWLVSFMAVGEHNPLFINLKSMFLKYWGEYDKIVDYFLFDFFIQLNYEKDKKIRNMIDDVPLNNIHVYRIFKLFYRFYNRDKFNEISKQGFLCNVTYKHQKLLKFLPFTLYKYFIKKEKNGFKYFVKD